MSFFLQLRSICGGIHFRDPRTGLFGPTCRSTSNADEAFCVHCILCAIRIRQKEIGYVVFESYRDGHAEIYRMNADGSDEVRLTHFKGPIGENEEVPPGNSNPSWSPR